MGADYRIGRRTACLLLFFILVALAVPFLGYWSGDAGLTLIGLAALLLAYAGWPYKVPPLEFVKDLWKGLLTIFGLVGITVAFLGFGRLTGWDVVTGLGEALADLLTAGG